MPLKVVEFQIGDINFAGDIQSIIEVIEYQKVVKVPNTPDFVEGIINLRGEVIPIIDLAKRFAIYREDDKNKRKKIMIAQVEDKTIGLIVDDVSRVLDIPDEKIDAVDVLTGVSEETLKYLLAVAKMDDKLILLIDISKLLSKEEKSQL